MKRANQNFTITAGGRKRLIFWIDEGPEGDLQIIVRHPRYIRLDVEGENPARKREIQNLYFSVHRTTQSPTQINALTANIKIDHKARNVRALHYTEAMKQHGRAASVFIVRSSNLDHDQFLKDDAEGDFHSLGSYNPSHFQLLYHVLVSSKDPATALMSDGPTNCKQIDFKYFRLTVLWTFVSIGSDISGHIQFFSTLKPEELEAMPDGDYKTFVRAIAQGFSPSDLHELFRNGTRKILKDDYIRRNAQSDRPENKNLVELLNASDFFKNGDPDSSKYRRHIRRLAKRLAHNQLVFPLNRDSR
jgi:hypothetical protein